MEEGKIKKGIEKEEKEKEKEKEEEMKEGRTR